MTEIWDTNTEISQLGFKWYLYPCSKPLLVIFKKLYGNSIKFKLFRAATCHMGYSSEALDWGCVMLLYLTLVSGTWSVQYTID